MVSFHRIPPFLSNLHAIELHHFTSYSASTMSHAN
nr:MAG TPA: hypothetical protein [Caudoviricetes sp.]